MLRYVPSIPTLVRVFIMNGCWILSLFFLYLLRWSCGFWLLLFNVIYYIDVYMLTHSCEPGIVMVYDLFCVLNLVCWFVFVLTIFMYIVIRDIGLEFYFLVVSLSDFGISMMGGFIGFFESIPFFSTFCKRFRRISISSL